MNWTKDKSILLSMICTVLCAACLLALDVGAFRLIPWYCSFRAMPEKSAKIMVTLYSASVFGWICLAALWKLLHNIRSGEVFTDTNVKLLRILSWTMAGAAVIFLVSGFVYEPFFFLSAAAAFMMLILRVVKNVFQQAVGMKSELDLTI